MNILSPNPHEVLTTWQRERITGFVALFDCAYHCPFCSCANEVNLHLNMIGVAPQPILAKNIIEAFDSVKCEAAAKDAMHYHLFCERCARPARIVYNDFEVAMGSWVFVPVQVLVADLPMPKHSG